MWSPLRENRCRMSASTTTVPDGMRRKNKPTFGTQSSRLNSPMPRLPRSLCGDPRRFFFPSHNAETSSYTERARAHVHLHIYLPNPEKDAGEKKWAAGRAFARYPTRPHFLFSQSRFERYGTHCAEHKVVYHSLPFADTLQITAWHNFSLASRCRPRVNS